MIKNKPALIALLTISLSLLLSSCSDPKLQQLNQDAVILAFGDSLTYGIGSSAGKTYPQALQDLTSFTVVNAGISGETTSQGLKRFRATLDKHSPDLIVLLEGGNDILQNLDQQLIKVNLASMIEMAQADYIPVLLIGVPEKKLFSDSAKIYSELAQTYNLVLEEEILSDLLRSAQYKSDPVHLNSLGYQKLAERINQLLKDNGAIL